MFQQKSKNSWKIHSCKEPVKLTLAKQKSHLVEPDVQKELGV